MEKDKLKRKNYRVFTITKEFIEKHPDNYEHLVALQSNEVAKYISANCKNITDTIEGLVRIQNAANKSKYIYRKAVASSTHGLDADHAMLSSRSMKVLDIKEYDEIIIKQTSWFFYLWNHYDTTIRAPFQVAVIFGVLSFTLGVLSLIISCVCCNC